MLKEHGYVSTNPYRSEFLHDTGIILAGEAAPVAVSVAKTAMTYASAYGAAHPTAATAATLAPLAWSVLDDLAVAYAAASGDPYAQQQAMVASQMAQADGGSGLFDGLGGLRAAVRIGGRGLADFLANCGAHFRFGGGDVDPGLWDKVVYRALRPDDRQNIESGLGLFARSWPAKGVTPESHVAGQYQSPWISTGLHYDRIRNRFDSGNGIAVIDLSRVDEEIVDFSNGIPGREGNRHSNAAKYFGEILIRDYIPPEAILTVIDTSR